LFPARLRPPGPRPSQPPHLGRSLQQQRAARLLLRRTPRLTALFCANDELAIGALQSARALGLNCAADVSIIGFDNINASLLAMPPFTTGVVIR